MPKEKVFLSLVKLLLVNFHRVSLGEHLITYFTLEWSLLCVTPPVNIALCCTYTVGRGRAWIHCALSRGSPSCKPHQRSLGRKNTWMALSPGACDCAAQNCPDNLVPYCTHHIWTPQLPSTLQTFVWSWSTHCYLAFSAILVGRVLSLVCQVFCFPILGTPSLETSLETQPPWNNLWYLSVRKLQQLEFRFYVTGKKQLVKLIPERKSDRQALNRPMVSLFQIISNLYLWWYSWQLYIQLRNSVSMAESMYTS